MIAAAEQILAEPVLAVPEIAAELSETASRMAASLDALLGKGEDGLSNDALQTLLAALVTLYAAKIEAGHKFPPIKPNIQACSATDIMILTSQLLKVGNLQVFELGMWQSYTGR
ncbi:MAG: hypothetical protein ACK4NA_00325 [Alphaproteobacteria bacterium]